MVLGISAFLVSFLVLPSQAAGQACTSYVVVTAFDRKTGDDIKELNAGDFAATLGKDSLPVISATQQFSDRLLVLLETDGTNSEKIEDAVNLATRLARQAPEGKPVAFGVFVKRSAFTKGFSTDPKKRAAAISEVIEEANTLGKRVALYNALHEALAIFGQHQPGDTVLLIADGYDDGSDRSGNAVEKEFAAKGTRLLVMLRQQPSHVTGNFLWNPPEHDIKILQRMSGATGGTYTMFSAHDFAIAWQGYMLGIRLPDGAGKAHKLKLRLQGAPAITYRRPNLYYPERLPPCSPTMAQAR